MVSRNQEISLKLKYILLENMPQKTRNNLLYLLNHVDMLLESNIWFK